ncbi:hypothetical protein BCON_0492g00050 [Botryotinia convoluta]|uniref:DUF8035 domain-containing protein n=1 Tax=Botryotinia convoluta TaxID=54673 RepID=A0A4Z1H604_9HELO|nr:hypothetical protein BCON_0492g00050 [Botryotinia convoluta]
MSVGTSSDIRKVSILCRDVYRKCREAGAEYEEIRREEKGLYGVLRELKEEEEERNGEWDEGNWGSVEGIIGDCEGTLRQLDGLLGRYGRNGGGRLGSNEMDQLGGIRVRLISHKKNISHFLDSLLHEDEDGDEKEAEGLDGKGELDMLLDKVDDIAADRSRRVGTSQMMGSENEDEEDNLQIWKWFRRNLIEEGVNRVVLERHKDVLIAYIRQMEQDGLLIENPSASTPQTSPRTPHKERWDSTHSELSHTQAAPPSFDNTNINIRRNDPGAKEMIQREDNIKSPPAMKFQRPKPESLDSYPYPGQNISSAPHRQLSPPLTPKISTTDLDISESQCGKDISGSKLNSEDNTSLMHQTISRYPVNSNHNNTSIIQTSDLLLLPCFTTSNPQLLPPSSPGSCNSNSNSYSYPNEPPNKSIQSPQLKTMTLRPKHSSDPVQKSSARTSGVRFDLPDSNQSSKTHTPSSGNNPHDSTIPIPIPTSILKSKIAPDSSGHEIPQDAKWTKVKRSLISPEVLMKDGRRFEARPEFVAILGILTKEEIQQYAERSHVLREERWWRNHPEQRERRERRERSERSRRKRNSEEYESSSCSSNSSSEMSSDSDSDINEHRRRGEKRNGDARGKGRRGDEREERGERRERKGRSERYNRRERDREANHTFAPQSQPQPQPQHFSSSPYSASNNSLPGRGIDIPGTNQTPNGYAPLGSFPGQQNYPQQGYPPPPQQQPPYPTQNQFPQPPYPQGPPPQINQNQYLSPNPYAPYSTSPSGSSPTYPPSQGTSPYTNTYTPNPSHPSYPPQNSRRYHSHSHSRSPHSHSHHSHSRARRSRDLDPRSSESRRQNSGTASTSTSTSKWRDHLAAAGIGGGLGGAAAGLWEVLSEAAEGF